MRYFEPTQEQIDGWNTWLNDRPPNVKAVASRFAPWVLYKLKATDQRVFVTEFDEHDDGKVTCVVGVSKKYNLVLRERLVFGIDPDDLTECDLPTTGELIGIFGESVSQRQLHNG